MNYPDLYANQIKMRRLRLFWLLAGVTVFCLALGFMKTAHNAKLEAKNALEAFKYAETLLPSAPPPRRVVTIDAKQKAYLADLKATASRLSIDWGARIATVESALSAEVALNTLRVDAQRHEIELRGETSSNAKLTAMVGAIQKAGLDARVGRLARIGSGLEYSVLIAWPQ